MTDRSELPGAKVDVAVIVPCYNEEATIGPLVVKISQIMPQARIVVIDNNSDDATAMRAHAAGAEVMKVSLKGKGNAIRSAFDRIDADVYVMMDGDGTYDPGQAPALVQRLMDNGLDMVIGARQNITVDAGRRGHAAGNRMFNALYAGIFGRAYSDIFSGYRIFSRRYVKSFPAISSGFEIETEMSIHAQMLRLEVEEVPVTYGKRPSGSVSKLSTHRDGLRILGFLMLCAKEVRPFSFFASLAVASLGASLALAVPIILDFLRTGLVEKQPTWFLSVGLAIVGLNMFFAGVILDSVARGRLEQKMLILRSIPCSGLPMTSLPNASPSADRPRLTATAIQLAS